MHGRSRIVHPISARWLAVCLIAAVLVAIIERAFS